MLLLYIAHDISLVSLHAVLVLELSINNKLNNEYEVSQPFGGWASICIYEDCRVTLLNKYTLTGIYAYGKLMYR